MGASADAIRELVEPALSSSDLELWDVEITHDTVRVLVDRAGGIDLDTLAATAGGVVSPILDEHPELTPAGTFQLEVSSPGVERTLRRVDQFSRYVGSEVSVKTSVAVCGARRHQGTLLSADARAISIAPNDQPAGSVLEIPLGQVERARTVLVWGPSPKPSSQKPSPQKPRSQKQAKQSGTKKAVKRPAATGLAEAGKPVASIEPKDVTS